MGKLQRNNFELDVDELDHDLLDTPEYACRRLAHKAKEIESLIQELNQDDRDSESFTLLSLEHLIADLIGVLGRYKHLKGW